MIHLGKDGCGPFRRSERMSCSGIIQAPHACEPRSTPGMRMLEIVKLVADWVALICDHTPRLLANVGGPLVRRREIDKL